MGNFDSKIRSKYERIFYELIKEALWNSIYEPNKNANTLDFLCLPSFENYFLLHFSWNYEKAIWNRVDWKKENDNEIIQLWFEHALEKNEVLPIDFSFQITEGIIKLEELNEVLNKFNSLSVKSFYLSKYSEKGKDGEDRRLKFSGDGISICFEWVSSNTPIEWLELDKIVDSIHSLNNKLSHS